MAKFYQKATVQSALVHGLITFIAIIIAGIAILVDRDYYITSMKQSQENFNKNYRRDSTIQANQMELTQMQIDLLRRQMKYDSSSLEKQLSVAHTQLQVLLQENKNQLLAAKEKLRRTLWEMSRLLPHTGYNEFKSWSNAQVDTLLGRIYEHLVRESSNPIVLMDHKMDSLWKQFMKRIEFSRISYSDTAQVRFIDPYRTMAEQWANQRYRDGSFVCDRTWALMLLLNNREIPNELLGFRDPEDYWVEPPDFNEIIK